MMCAAVLALSACGGSQNKSEANAEAVETEAIENATVTEEEIAGILEEIPENAEEIKAEDLQKLEAAYNALTEKGEELTEEQKVQLTRLQKLVRKAQNTVDDKVDDAIEAKEAVDHKIGEAQQAVETTQKAVEDTKAAAQQKANEVHQAAEDTKAAAKQTSEEVKQAAEDTKAAAKGLKNALKKF